MKTEQEVNDMRKRMVHLKERMIHLMNHTDKNVVNVPTPSLGAMVDAAIMTDQLAGYCKIMKSLFPALAWVVEAPNIEEDRKAGVERGEPEGLTIEMLCEQAEKCIASYEKRFGATPPEPSDKMNGV